MRFTSPVIVFGMHRSGTSLVTGLLEQLGMFVGHEMDENKEALFFLRLNDWMLRLSGGAWDQPSPIRLLHDDVEVRSLVIEFLRRMMVGRQTREYLGPRGRMWRGSMFELGFPWGWKDPRNTFTLPIWLELFPGARAVHVLRHGVAVASSLRARRAQTIAMAAAAMSQKPPSVNKPSELPHLVDSLRCGTLGGGLSLWEEYVGQARNMLGTLENRAIEVRYEDLLGNPQTVLNDLAQFCGLDPAGGDIARIVGQLRNDRASAYRQDPELQELAASNQSRLERFGY